MSFSFALPFNSTNILATQLPNGLVYVDADTGQPTGNSHIGGDASAFDFALSLGTPVLSVAPGIVISSVDTVTDGAGSASEDRYGNFVTIRHDLGGGQYVFATYAHLQQSGVAQEGAIVGAGTVIGFVGETGHITGPHLHIAFGLAAKDELISSGADADGTKPDRADAQGNNDIATFGNPSNWILNPTFNEFEYAYTAAATLAQQLGALEVNLNGNGQFSISDSVGEGFNTDTWNSDDYFRFTASENGTLTIQLSAMTEDLDLRLLSATGQRVNQSINNSALPEVVTHNVAAGDTLLIHIDPYKLNSSNYDLELTFTPTASPLPLLPNQDSLIYFHDTSSQGNLAVWNLNSGSFTHLGAAGTQVTDIAMAPDGTLYAISFTQLFRMNTNTAEITLVGNLGVSGANALEIDAFGNAYMASSSNTNLYKLDLIGGAATLIGDTGKRSAGDLSFHSGKLFLTTTNRTVAELDTQSAAILSEFSHSVFDLFGLSSGTFGFHAFARDDIYIVDLSNSSVTFFADLDDYGFSFGSIGGSTGNEYGQSGFLIRGIAGADLILGQAKDDILYGNGGDDQIVARSGNDLAFGGGANDLVIGDGGQDTLIGEAGDDTLKGEDGDDVLFGGFGKDRADGGLGNDFIRTGPDNDTLIGGDGDDTLGASNRTDLLRGGDGNDLLLGSNGNDRLFGDAGSDTLLGGNGRDTIEGGGGKDRLVGGGGNDRMRGGVGDDTFLGGAGNDRFAMLATQAGDDTILDFEAGAGAGDVIRLIGFGAAFDTFAEVLAAATQSGADTIIDFGGGTTITLAGVNVGDLHADDFVFG